MKNRIKMVLLTATLGATAASVQATTYNGDLILGFTASSGNDLIYDLGPASSLTDGQTWNLGPTGFNLLSGFNLNNVNWGVVGDAASPRGIWTSADPNAGTPASIPGASAWSSIDGNIKTIYQHMPSAAAGQHFSIDSGDTTSWNQQTVIGGGNDFLDNYGSPNVVGLTTENFYDVLANNSNPAQLGTFSLAANGVVTFHALSTAPPAPALTITRSGVTNIISFGTTNGATYTLLVTNIAGLTSPRSNWFPLGSSIIGAGGTTNFRDTNITSGRVYSVTAH